MGLTRSVVIVNPTAGHGRARRVWAQLRLAQPAVECVMTDGPGHAGCLAREATDRGVERVVAVGGDGTVSEVAGALAGTDVALGVVPCGTGNDFSRTLRLPRAPEAALRLALEGPSRRVDVGWLTVGDEERAFVCVAGCGFDAEVVRRTHAAAKRLGGTLPYLLGVLQTLSAFRPCELRFVLDGQPIERRALGVAVAIGPSYGGGMLIAPRALMDDGLFEVCLIGDLGPVQLLALLPSLYAGTHGRHPAVEFFQCRELRVEPLSSAEVCCQADGELLGAVPATFRIQPLGLRCVAP